MNEDGIAGTARNLGDKVGEGVGASPGISKSRSGVSSTRWRGLHRISTGRPRTWREILPSRLKNGCGVPLKPSPTRRRRLRSVLAGLSEECTVRYKARYASQFSEARAASRAPLTPVAACVLGPAGRDDGGRYTA
jgi:hypothetical protein